MSQPPLVRIAAIDRELTGLYGRVRVLLDERGRLVASLVGPGSATGAAGPAASAAGWGRPGAGPDVPPAAGLSPGGAGAGAGVAPDGRPGAGPGFGPGIPAVGSGVEAGRLGAGPGGPGAGPAGAGAGPARGRGPGPGAGPRREASPVTAQTVLLALGGLLLGTASLVFLAVAWNRSGVAGRALVLLTLTAAALAAPRFLLRRSLGATAETVAAIGLLLCALDTGAAWRLDLAGVRGLGGLAYAALVTATLAGGAYAYSRALPLRGPRWTAVVLTQLPLPLLALAADAPPAGIAVALLGTVLLDALLARLDVAPRLAIAGGVWSWSLAVLAAVPAGYAGSWAATAAGVLAGLVALGAAAVAGPLRPWVAAAAVLELAAVATGILREPFGNLLAPALAGLPAVGAAALLGGSRRHGTPGAEGWRRGALGAGAVVLGLAGVAPVAGALAALSLPASIAAAPWTGIVPVPASVTAAATPTVLLAGLLVTAGLALAAALAGRRALVPPVLAAGALLVVLLTPAAYALPLPAVLTGLATLTVAAAVLAVRASGARPGTSAASGWGVGGAPVLAGLTVAWGLAARPATLVVLGGLAVLATAVAAATRPGPVPAPGAAGPGAAGPGAAGPGAAGPGAAGPGAAVGAWPAGAVGAWPAGAAGAGRAVGVRVTAAAVAGLALGAETVALALAAGTSPRVLAFALLGLVAVLAGTAAALRRPRPPESYAVELAAVPAAVLALGAAATRGWSASLAFGLLGAILLAVALRPDRRPAAYAGAAAVQVAGWIALGTAGVVAPEAYTGPLSVLLLGVGALRRRTGASSWSAYGPGLLVTAGPSLALALDTGGLRALLLGAAALVVVLLGARARLQAPLAIGAAVLVLLALNEAGPALLGWLAGLPRWVPPAVGGALLLGTGATYERRLRDLRRARAAFTRLG